MGYAIDILGDNQTSIAKYIEYHEEILVVRKKLGDLRGMAASMLTLALVAGGQCRFEDAERLTREALIILRDIDDRQAFVSAHGVLGTVLVWQGKFVEARSVEHEILVGNKDLGVVQSWIIWNYSVSGFPDLFLGEYDAARKQAQQALVLNEETKHHTDVYSALLCKSILGRVALAEGSYATAKRWFQECLPLYQTRGDVDNEGQELACLGFVSRAVNQITQAQRHLFDALQVAIDKESYLSLMQALPGVALLFADQGEIERAVELYALAATQGIVANSKWFDDIAGDEIAAAAESLPAEVV